MSVVDVPPPRPDPEAVAALADAVLASSHGTALVPAAQLATITAVEPVRIGPRGSRLRIAFKAGSGRYRYFWPEAGTVEDAITPAEWARGGWVTIVLTHLTERLEAADFGLRWSLERGYVAIALPDGPPRGAA